MQIFVDGDACPVKQETLRVAGRHGVKVTIVANSWMRLGDNPLLQQVVVGEGLDLADDWIAAHVGTGNKRLRDLRDRTAAVDGSDIQLENSV